MPVPAVSPFKVRFIPAADKRRDRPWMPVQSGQDADEILKYCRVQQPIVRMVQNPPATEGNTAQGSCDGDNGSPRFLFFQGVKVLMEGGQIGSAVLFNERQR